MAKPGPVGHLGQHLAPGVQDHRLPPVLAGVPPGLEAADLRCGGDEALGLDRPRAQQDLPMVLAGLQRERRGDHDELRTFGRQPAVQLAEA